MRHRISRLICATLLMGSAALADTRPVVVELFTSQGCSSCPPADSFLGELAARPDVIALAYHVDYWDGLGWSDRFALPIGKQRQAGYARRLQLATVFTPQLIVQGRQSLVGSAREPIAKALRQSTPGLALTAKLQEGMLVVDLPAQSLRRQVEIHVAAYQAHASTLVHRGENSGRRLEEFNIVRAWRTLGTWDGRRQRYSLPVASLPAEAAYAAVLVQEPQEGSIEAAVRVALR